MTTRGRLKGLGLTSSMILLLCLVFSSHIPQKPTKGLLAQQAPAPEIKEYKPTPLPLSTRTATTWLALHERKAKVFPDKTAFNVILEGIRERASSKSIPINLIVDTECLPFQGVTLQTAIDRPDIKHDDISVNDYLKAIVMSLNLDYYVYDNLILISYAIDDSPRPPQVSGAEARTWLRLNETVSVSIPKGTSLSRAISLIQEATTAQRKTNDELKFSINPMNLLIVKDKPAPLEMLSLHDLPLCTELGLILRHYGLGFYVRNDGVVAIEAGMSSDEALIFDVNDLANSYQSSLYAQFCNRHRLEAKLPKNP